MKPWLFVRPPSPHQLQKSLQDQKKKIKDKEEDKKSKLKQDED